MDNGNSYQFFHESFFDYAFASLFCSQEKSLKEFLTQEGEEQHLFRRAQVRQILGYRRENRWEEYLHDLREVLSSDDIRFHIRRMVASELRRITDPSAAEWDIIKGDVLAPPLSRAISGVIRNHIGWFDLLNRLGVWQQWLAHEEVKYIDAAIWFLEDHELHKLRSSAIASLLQPYVDRGGEWDVRLKRILSWGVAHHSAEMQAICFHVIQRGIYDDESRQGGSRDFWGNFYNAEKENPRFIIDLVHCWFEHSLAKYDDGDSWKTVDRAPLNRSHTGSMLLAKAAQAEPAWFLDRFLVLFELVVKNTEIQKGDRILNRIWPHVNNSGDPHDLDDAILFCLRHCLQSIARTDAAEFRRLTASVRDLPHEIVAFVMLSAYAENPSELANECIEYLLSYRPRLNIGYGSWSGGLGHGESAVTRHAIAAVSPHCSNELRVQLEDSVIYHADEFEQSTPRYRGFAEYLILQAIDPAKRSQRANIRIEELRHKFPNLSPEIPPPDDPFDMRVVGPPIPEDRIPLMSDAQWLSAMLKYDGSKDDFKGGPIELSRALAVETRKDRHRFVALAFKMPDTIDAHYFSEILNGMTAWGTNLNTEDKAIETERLQAFPTDLLTRLIHRLHELPNRPCGTSILHCIERIADRDLPQDIFELVSWYAANDPDPDSDIWQVEAGSSYYYGGDPFHHGINCVRGQAAMTIAALLRNGKSNVRATFFRPTIRIVATDRVLSVRSCGIEALRALLNAFPDEAVDGFLECCIESEALWSTTSFHWFLCATITRYFDQLQPLVQLASVSSNSKAVEIAATVIIESDLLGTDTRGDADAVRSGTDQQRAAACHIYAKKLFNADDRTAADRSAEFLLPYFNDENEQVLQNAANAFWHTTGERLLELEPLIQQFIESKAFAIDPEHLLRALEESNARLPHVVCRAAERVLEVVGDAGASVAYRGFISAQTISTLIIRQYAQATDPKLKRQCLDLIDRLERQGYMGITEELNKLDR